MDQLLAAINAGNFNSAITAAIFLLLSNYAKEIVTDIVSSIVSGLHYLQDRASQQQNQLLAQVEKRLLDKVIEAVEGMMPLAEELKKLTTTGKLTKEDIKHLESEAFDLFISNLTPTDWISFATHLIDPSKADAPKEFIEARLEKRFKTLHSKAVNTVKVQRAQNEFLLSDPATLKKSLGLS